MSKKGERKPQNLMFIKGHRTIFTFSEIFISDCKYSMDSMHCTILYK